MGKSKKRARSRSSDRNKYAKRLEIRVSDLERQLEREKRRRSVHHSHTRSRSRSVSVTARRRRERDSHPRDEHADRHDSPRRSRSPLRLRPSRCPRMKSVVSTLPNTSSMGHTNSRGSDRDSDTRSVSRSRSSSVLSTAVSQTGFSTGRASNDTADAKKSGGRCPSAASPANRDILDINPDVELSDDDLTLLGEDPLKTNSNQIRFHKEVASRWTHILSKGIPEENSQEIMGKYKIPDNCKLLTPPTVNPELKFVMPTAYVTRDTDHSNYQLQLAKGISAVGSAINVILNNKESIQKEVETQLLGNLSDSGRILSNLHYKISKVRQYLLMPLVDPPVRGALKEAPPGEMLFDTDISTQVQIVKNREKIGKDLRSTNKNQPHSSSLPKKKRGGGSKPSSTPAYDRYQGNRRNPAQFRGEMKPMKGYRPRRDKYQHQTPRKR